jgi:hypothetical protein
MAIKYADQASLVADVAFRAKVQAGMFVVALNVQSQAITGLGVDLANEVIERSSTTQQYAVTQFCWTLVGQQSVNGIDDLQDNQIRNLINSNWNAVALALSPFTGMPAGP